tara:strand:- start:7754 stop:8182 length:429 start_codon:yes stop_codon:yes gene_type:complete
MRRGQGILLLGACLVALAGCKSASTPDAGTGSDNPPFGTDGTAVRFNPNIRIGEIVWINERGDFAVVRMDAPRAAFQPAFLLAADPEGTQKPAILVGGGEVEGRSFGARIMEGPVPEGAEVRIPGPEWTEYLYNRYNNSEQR